MAPLASPPPRKFPAFARPWPAARGPRTGSLGPTPESRAGSSRDARMSRRCAFCNCWLPVIGGAAVSPGWFAPGTRLQELERSIPFAATYVLLPLARGKGGTPVTTFPNTIHRGTSGNVIREGLRADNPPVVVLTVLRVLLNILEGLRHIDPAKS